MVKISFINPTPNTLFQFFLEKYKAFFQNTKTYERYENNPKSSKKTLNRFPKIITLTNIYFYLSFVFVIT